MTSDRQYVGLQISTSGQLIALLVALMLVSGCSSSARFKLRDGRQTSGRIVQGGEDAIVIKRDGEYWVLKRDDIADVSHPGTGEMVTGAMLLGLVGLVAYDDFSSPDDCARSDGETYGGGPCYGRGWATFWAAIVLGIPGLILGGDGVATHSASRSRYSSTGGGHLIDLPTTPARAAPVGPLPTHRCGSHQEKQSCEAGGGVCLALGPRFVCVLPGTSASTTPAPTPEPTPTNGPDSAPINEPEPAPTNEPEPPEPTEPTSGATAPAPTPVCDPRNCQ